MSHDKKVTFFEEGNKVTPENLKDVFHAVVRSHAQRVTSYCWHPNGESNDGDGLHKFLNISKEDLVKILLFCGYIKAGSTTMTKKAVDELAASIDSEKNIAESNSYRKLFETIPTVKRKQCHYLRLGMKSQIEGCYTDASQQYNKTKLEHLPQPSFHFVERTNIEQRKAHKFISDWLKGKDSDHEEVDKREATPAKKHHGAQDQGHDAFDVMFGELLHLLHPGKAANRRDIKAARKIVHNYIRTALEQLGAHLSNTAKLSEAQESTDDNEATLEEALCGCIQRVFSRSKRSLKIHWKY